MSTSSTKQARFLQREDEKVAEEFQQWIKEQWGWKKLPIGGVVPYPGSSKLFKTGEWRDITPIVDIEKCTGCTMCYFVCPDDAIRLRAEDRKAIINYDYCKGCTLCKEICPVDAIHLIESPNSEGGDKNDSTR